MFRNYPQANGAFPLASYLAESVGRSWPDVPHKVYSGAAIPRVDVGKIAYFAASIFWRASIHHAGNNDLQIRLGPFEEAFRKYLAGESDFPEDATLRVIVRPNSLVTRVMEWPTKREREEGAHSYRFIMPGFMFWLLVTRNPGPDFRIACLVRGDGNPIIFSDALEQGITSRAQQAVNDTPAEELYGVPPARKATRAI